MLGDANPNPPKKVTVKIARAENLELSMKEGKKKLNSKFKVMIRGGKDKQVTPIAEDQFGKPTWNLTCSVKLHRHQTDPLCLLIEDSEGRHKGQVIIPIVQIKPRPYTYTDKQEPANSTNLLCSELEPTHKQSNPRGYLLYWIWVDEYYTQEEMNEDSSGRRSFNKSMHNLFGSKNRLSGSKSTLSGSNADSINRLGSISELNKPVKHKSGNMLKLKLPGGLGKKKNKHSNSMGPMPAMSAGMGGKFQDDGSDSDVDSRCSYGYNNLVVGNPFDHNERPSTLATTAGISSSKHVQRPSSIESGSLESGSIFVRTPASSFNQKEPHEFKQPAPPPPAPVIHVHDNSDAIDPFKRHSPTASINLEKNVSPFLDSSFSDSRELNTTANSSTTKSDTGRSISNHSYSNSKPSDNNMAITNNDPFKIISPTASNQNIPMSHHHQQASELSRVPNGMNFILPQSEDHPFFHSQKTTTSSEFSISPSNRHTIGDFGKPISPLIYNSSSNNNKARGSSLGIHNAEQEPPISSYEQARNTINVGSTGLEDSWLNGSYSKRGQNNLNSGSKGFTTLPDEEIEDSLKDNEFEALQNECAELKNENQKLKTKLDYSESELLDVKNKLWKLRVRLLEAGQTEFLEI